jgi:predicted nucleic acid-binding Zn finger protein
MNAREERGLVIAATTKLTQKGKIWIVPSQNGAGKYTVSPDPACPYCSCPDHAETGERCKHLYAVEIVMKRDTSTDGTITFTEKKVYRKAPMAAFNLAQIEEKRRFLALLADLVRDIKSPPQVKGGRPRTPLADMIFTAVYKVYSTLSSRRYGTDLAEAAEQGYIAKAIHPCMVCSFLENEMMTPVLTELVSASALPLQGSRERFRR